MYKRISRNKEEFSRLVERVYKKPSIPDHQTAQQSSPTYPACHLDCVVFVRGLRMVYGNVRASTRVGRSCLTMFLPNLVIGAFHSTLLGSIPTNELCDASKTTGPGISTRMLRLSVNPVLPILPSG